jgi:hypothetical protein
MGASLGRLVPGNPIGLLSFEKYETMGWGDVLILVLLATTS